MGGLTRPGVNRSNINTAALPGLTPSVNRQLQGFLQNPQQSLQQFQPTSALQQNVRSGFEQLIGGFKPSQQSATALQNMGIDPNMPGAGMLGAYLPVWQRALGDTTNQLRQSGPRFSTATGQLVQQAGQRSLQDFNLAAQQINQNAIQQLTGALGAAGSYDTGVMQAQMPLIQQLLGGAMDLGTGAPIITTSPSPLQTGMDIVGTITALIAAMKGVPSPTGGGGSMPPPFQAQSMGRFYGPERYNFGYGR